MRFICWISLALTGSIALAQIPEQTLSVKEVLGNEGLAPAEKAEKLAVIGEALLMPQSIDEAFQVFEEALKLDPRNDRANFYLKSFGALRLLKGYLTRLQPVIEATGDGAYIQHYYRQLNLVWPYFRGDIKDLKTDGDVRRLVDALGEAWDQAREYFGGRTAPLELRTAWFHARYTVTRDEPVVVTEWRDGQWTKRPTGETQTVTDDVDGLGLAARHCTVDQPEPGVYHVAACSYLTVRPYVLDFADAEALRGYAAGLELLAIATTAYNTDGAIKLLAKTHGVAYREGRVLTDLEIVQTLVNGGAGALEATHKLGRVRALGTDLIAAVKWLKRIQSELCQPRPGFVLRKGVCLSGKGVDPSDVEKLLGYVEATLAANPVDVSNGRGVDTQVRLHQIFDAPVANLNLIAPQLFDVRGNVATLPDATLNGVFVNADAPKFYSLKAR